MQGQVSTAYVTLLYEFLERRGFEPAQVLGEPAPAADAHTLARFPVDRWALFLRRADEFLREPALGLQVGSLIAPQHLGVLGYVSLCCANLGEALLRLRDYERLVYDVNVSSVTFGAQDVRLEWGQALGRPGQLVDECAVAALVSYARNITASQASPLSVSFINVRPADTGPYEAFFGCEVAFEAPTTVLRFAAAQMETRLRQPDPALCALLDAQARELTSRLPPRDDFESRLRGAIVAGLRENAANLTDCARRMHCSSRTLQRRLESAGTTFQDSVDAARREIAVAYLRDPRLKLSEVALLLGYSEQSAFTRAFARWTGKPPTAFRRE